MKKMNYQAPEMEVVELDYQKPLLDGSGSLAPDPSEGLDD